MTLALQLDKAEALRPVLNETRCKEMEWITGERPLTQETLALLLSPAVLPHLEAMAKAAQNLTRRHFGKVMQMYAPIYLSDHCVNQCTYCGFRVGGQHGRTHLSEEQIRSEGKHLHRMGYRNVLLLTGESRKYSGVEYIEDALINLSTLFPMMGLEVYPLETEEYRRLAQAGAESLSLYQETYDRVRYSQIHPGGPKANYDWRLEGPERGCAGGLRSVNLGVLLGLGDWRMDVLKMAIHGRWLQLKYPEVQIGFSLPRMRPAAESLFQPEVVGDRQFVQALLALRLWMPQSDITLSTREPAVLRDNLAGLCVTRMSAGSSTRVGGYTQLKNDTEDQFEISDSRSLEDVRAMLRRRDIEPVTQDWIALRGGAVLG